MHGSLSENSTEAIDPVPAAQSINAAQKFVVVKAPIAGVYEQWSRIEGLPRFITSLREVRRIDDKIVLQIPGRRIAWRTMSNGFMSGVVSFEARSEEETEVTLKIRSIFDPPSLSQRVEEYLRNFKRLIENGEALLRVAE